jgi:hypothetical protein
MPSKPKIPPVLEPELMKLAGDGKTSEDLAQWLWREHKIEVSSRQVRAFIKRRRDELADVAKAVVREELRKRLLPAVRRAARGGQHAEVIERRLLRKARQLRETVHEFHPEALQYEALALKAIDRQLKSANVLLHYAGLNTPDAPGQAAQPQQDQRAALPRRIDEIIKAGPPAPKSEPSVH